MDKYIGIRIVDAVQMYRHEAYKKGYLRLTPEDNIKSYPNDYGYHLIYDNGYESWCPADEFEKRNKPINPLRETAVLMNSNDYKDRFIAEYRQLQLRYDALCLLCHKWDNDNLDFTPTCPREIYDDQLLAMKNYLDILEKRAKIEKIKLK